MLNLSRIFYSIIAVGVTLVVFSSSYADTISPELETQLKQALEGKQSPQEISSIIIQHCTGLTEEQVAELLKKTIDVTPIGICWLNTNNVFMGLNQRALRDLGGKSIDDFIGKTIYDLYPPEMAEHLTKDNERVMQIGVGSVQNDGTVKDFTTGETEYYTIVKSPLRNEKGKVIGILGVATESPKQETERQNSKTEL